MKDSEKMSPVFEKSLEEILAVVSGKKPITDVTNTATKMVANYKGVLQAENNRASIGYRACKDFYGEDKEMMKEALANMSPTILPVKMKALPQKK